MGGLAASEGKLKHLGLSGAPARATLSYANEHSPWQLYQTVFQQLLEKCQQVVATQPGKKKRKFRFKNKLLSLDATVIALCASVFDWAKFRRSKGAVKLHLLLDHDGHLPSFAVVTEGKQHEVRVARQLRFAPGTILAIDRGYTDYQWFADLTKEGVYFVTRLKDNADYSVIEERKLPQRKGLQRDQVIFFYKLAKAGEEECFYRRVEYYDEETDQVLVFLTNHMRQMGVTFRLGEKVTQVGIDGTRDRVFAELESGKKVIGDALMYAVGRQANGDELNLQAAGLTCDSRGRLRVNGKYQTDNPHIYAAGDVIGFSRTGKHIDGTRPSGCKSDVSDPRRKHATVISVRDLHHS